MTPKPSHERLTAILTAVNTQLASSPSAAVVTADSLWAKEMPLQPEFKRRRHLSLRLPGRHGQEPHIFLIDSLSTLQDPHSRVWELASGAVMGDAAVGECHPSGCFLVAVLSLLTDLFTFPILSLARFA